MDRNTFLGPEAVPAGRVLFLDGWRGLAILLVLLGHFMPFAPVRLASAGVELFFVLSGRLMAELLIIRRHPLPDFVFRRASRLLPALCFYVAAMLLIIAANAHYGTLRDGLIGALAAIGLFHNYLSPEYVVPTLEHCWSLAVEEHSYLLLAAIAVVSVRDRRLSMTVAAVVAAAAVFNGWWMSREETPLGQNIYWRTDVRMASVLLPFVIHLWIGPRVHAARSRLWGCVSPLGIILGLAILVYPAVPEHVRFSLGTLVLGVSVATLDVAFAPFRRMLECTALTWLGLISYSLYLWQQPYFMLSRESLPSLVSLVLAMTGGILSFRIVERPARQALNGWWSSQRRGEIRSFEENRKMTG